MSRPYGINTPSDQRVASILASSANADSLGEEIKRLNKFLSTNTSSETTATFSYIEVDNKIQILVSKGYVADRSAITSFPLPIFGGGGGTLKQHLSQVLSEEWLKQVLSVANQDQRKQRFEVNYPPQYLLSAVQLGPVIEVVEINREKYDSRQAKGKKKFSFMTPTPTPVAAPSIVPNTSTQNSAVESEIRCHISFVKPPATRMPAIVDFEVGLASFSPNPSDKKIGGVQIDYTADGEWDTDLSPAVSTYQSHVYYNYGLNRIAARVELTNGQVTKPCFAEFNLR